MIEIWFDGACEPINPGGTCGFGSIIHVDRKKFWEKSGVLYPVTKYETSNNVAEYLALNQALIKTLKENSQFDHASSNCIYIYGDSQLVINQMKGVWKIKSGIYKPYAEQCRKLLDALEYKGYSLHINWIPREENYLADELSKRELKRAGVKFKIQPEQ